MIRKLWQSQMNPNQRVSGRGYGLWKYVSNIVWVHRLHPNLKGPRARRRKRALVGYLGYPIILCVIASLSYTNWLIWVSNYTELRPPIVSSGSEIHVAVYQMINEIGQYILVLPITRHYGWSRYFCSFVLKHNFSDVFIS